MDEIKPVIIAIIKPVLIWLLWFYDLNAPARALRRYYHLKGAVSIMKRGGPREARP